MAQPLAHPLSQPRAHDGPMTHPLPLPEVPLMYAPWRPDPLRVCRYCRWVEVIPRKGVPRGSLACTSPKACRGQAGEGKACCDFEREPGADDEV